MQGSMMTLHRIIRVRVMFRVSTFSAEVDAPAEVKEEVTEGEDTGAVVQRSVGARCTANTPLNTHCSL